MKTGVAANLSRHYQNDAREFFQLLVLLLEGALPDATQIERRGALWGKKRAFRVTVELDDYEYALEDAARGLQATRRHVVRGIALKTETLPVSEWIAELGAALEKRAQANQQAHDALAQWLT
jgi:hypothetical protein